MDVTRNSVPAAGRTRKRSITALCGIAIVTTLPEAGPGDVGHKRLPWMPAAASAAAMSEGQRLFDHETFGGNGRTCRTCHSGDDGTINPIEVVERLTENPSDPLFRHDGLDDFSSGTARIAEHATILIERELPPGVVLVDDPSAASVVLARGVPSTVNTPALDAALMYDMRDADLQDQATGAIERHAQVIVPPTSQQLDAIAEFQRTDNRFFSSKALRAFARAPRSPLPRALAGEGQQYLDALVGAAL